MNKSLETKIERIKIGSNTISDSYDESKPALECEALVIYETYQLW